MLIFLYRLLSVLFLPLIFVYLVFRLFKNKEPKNIRFFERLAISKIKLNHSKKIIWFHAASVGESLSIIPLINHFANHNKYQILVTSGTISSANLLAKQLQNKAIHQYIPIDSLFIVRRFLKKWQPSIAIWTESELWPNLICETSKQCKILLINARISEKSFNKWMCNLKFADVILSSISEIIAQSEVDFQRYKKLSKTCKNSTPISKLGNLKYCTTVSTENIPEQKRLLKKLKNKTIIMLASSHDDEETNIAQIYKKLISNNQDLFLIIAPRHPHRASAIVKQIQSKTDLSVAIRSKKQNIDDNTQIYLVDTIGEFGIFYRISNIVIIGGSFIKHGGQNLLEPAKLSNSIICGPYMYNFAEVTNDFLTHSAIIQVSNYNSFFTTISSLIKNQKLQKELMTNSSELANKSNEILGSYINKISKYIIN